MCKASLQEDEEVEEEDIDRETGIIRVQIAYAIQMQVLFHLIHVLIFFLEIYRRVDCIDGRVNFLNGSHAISLQWLFLKLYH